MLTPEQKAREQIDRMLEAAGWQVQARWTMDRTAAPGVAACEFPLTTGSADYLLFADGRPIGVVEAKPAGTPLSGVEPQAMKYCHARTPTWSEDTPDDRWRAFTYEELLARDKINLDIFWIRDESLEETANLPEPDVIAADIVEDLGAALEQFRLIGEDLGE